MGSFDKWLCRASASGLLMSGVKARPLSERQESLLSELERKKILSIQGGGKPLTSSQLANYGDLLNKKHAKRELSQTAKSFLDKEFRKYVTKRSKEVQSKMMDKGLICEDHSFNLIHEITGKWYSKNESRYKTDFFTGEMDNDQYRIVTDIKTSWDSESFPYAMDIPSKMNHDQIQVYMNITHESKEYEKDPISLGRAIYCLVDTPPDMVDGELKRQNYKLNFMSLDGVVYDDKKDLFVEMISNMIVTFDGLKAFHNYTTISFDLDWFDDFYEIPAEDRVQTYESEYDKNYISVLKEMVILARQYLNKKEISVNESRKRHTAKTKNQKIKRNPKKS